MQGIKNFLRHFFVPGEDNNFRAKALHLDFLTYYLLFALLISFGFKRLTVFKDVLGFATDITVEKLYQLTNEQRQKFNLPIFTYNDKLAQAATGKATDMFAKNYWSHYAPDGTTPWNFILNSGYRYEFAGENLAKNFLFSQGVVDAWMNSSTHKENIIRKEYTDIGFAIVNGVLNGQETTLVVQMLGKPLSSSLAQNKINLAVPETQAVENEKKSESTERQLSLVKSAKIARQSATPKINLLSFSFNLNILFLSLLLVALIADLYFATKIKAIRVSGKNLAHFVFIAFVLLAVIFFASKGSIL